jgi:hypothetical protein
MFGSSITPTLFFNYSDKAIDRCTHVYVHLVDKTI